MSVVDLRNWFLRRGAKMDDWWCLEFRVMSHEWRSRITNLANVLRFLHHWNIALVLRTSKSGRMILDDMYRSLDRGTQAMARQFEVKLQHTHAQTI